MCDKTRFFVYYTLYIMRFKLIIFLALFISFHGFSQEWFTNFEKAKETAVNSNHNIVLVFQGSDWCAPCIKLDKNVWQTKTFQNLAKNHFVMLKADFPRRKANKLSKELTLQNAKLAEKYNNQGFFPLVVVLDYTGKVLGKMGYEKLSPTAYFNKLTSFEN